MYAVFTTLTGIFGNVLSMRYELAVPIAKSDRDAAALAALAVFSVVASCALTVPIAWLGADWLARKTEMPELSSPLWAVPLTIVALSTAESASYWSVYRGTFGVNATPRLVQSAVQSALQVLFGLLGFCGRRHGDGICCWPCCAGRLHGGVVFLAPIACCLQARSGPRSSAAPGATGSIRRFPRHRLCLKPDATDAADLPRHALRPDDSWSVRLGPTADGVADTPVRASGTAGVPRRGQPSGSRLPYSACSRRQACFSSASAL